MKSMIFVIFFILSLENVWAVSLNIQGTNTGPIPDGPVSQYRTYGEPRDLLFNVDMPVDSSVREVTVTFEANHTFMSDLRVTLIAPDGRYFVLFETLGLSGNLFFSNLVSNNLYTFSDEASMSWWDAANILDADIPSGTYRTVVSLDTPPDQAPEVSSLNAMFNTANPEGTWILRFEDGWAADAGEVFSAEITLDVDDFAQKRMVTNTNDSGSGSLRQAILDANDNDKIEFDIPDNEITITFFTPLPDITNDITIVGRPDNLILLQMFNRNGRIINIPQGQGNTVTINQLRFRNGGDVSEGGCIFNGGKLFLTGSYVFDCNASSRGAGIFNGRANSELYVINSGISGNTSGQGAGIHNLNNSKAWIINSSIVNNNGAGINNRSLQNSSGYLELHNNSIVNNQGGGLFVLTQGENSSSENILSNNLFSNSGVNIGSQEGGGPLTITSKGFNLTTDDGDGYLVAHGDKINANAGIESVETTLGITVVNLSDSSEAIDAGRSVSYFKNDLSGEPNNRIVDFAGIPNFVGSTDFPNTRGDGSDIGAFEKQTTDVIFRYGFQ